MSTASDAPRSVAPSGKELLRESWRQLKQIRGLVGLTALSGIVCVLMFLLFVGPAAAWAIVLGDENTARIILPIALILGYVAASLAGAFFEGAVVSAALQQSLGKRTSSSLALAGARKRFGRLMVWGITDSTVNLALSLLRDRSNAFGGVLSVAGGLAWSVATYLALPVVLVEDRSPFAAIKRASELLRQAWGSALRVTVRFALYLLPSLLVASAMILGGLFLAAGGYTWPAIGVFLMGTLLLFAALSFAGVMKAYVKAQLYLYAAGRATSIPADLIRGGIQTA